MNESDDMTAKETKADILSPLRGDISNIIKEELKNVLAEDFNILKAELQTVQSEITNNMTTIGSEIDHVNVDIGDMKDSLSTWSDEVVSLQATVASLQTQVVTLTAASSVAKAGAAFMDVRKALRGQKGVRYGLLFPVRLRISHKEEDKEFLDPQKAMEYVQKIVTPATEPEDGVYPRSG